jgi:ubiquinone/menaquinone biosynthesis C-methylase UbiE
MQHDQYALMRAEEEAHWWYRGNRTVVRALLARALPGGGRRWLDAGCGTGKNLEAFAHCGEAVGIDFNEQAVRFSAGRGHRRVARASVRELPFADASFDLVTCFEVLNCRGVEPVPDALAEFARVLRPGGVALLREPAFPFLSGSHDVAVHTRERFRRRPFAAMVRAAGLTVETSTYQNLVTFFPALLIRPLQRWRRPQQAKADFDRAPRFLHGLLAAALGAERALLRVAPLPFGSSLLCVARKP